ncbi:MAG: hypothetical protein HYX24_00610 [Candidatus Aenigmarchaeota archaeon]|nr:hypothetical protein [Candidatus Aenigmarchaeota archaeon]
MITIALHEFPSAIYVGLEGELNQKLWDQLLQRGTIKQIAIKLELPVRNIYKYKEGNSGYPLKVLQKLLREANLEIEKATIKTQRDGKQLKVKLPMELREDFAEFLGYLFGDGGINHQWGVHLTMNDKEVLHRFDALIRKVFGEVERKEYDYGSRMTFYYPKILGLLLNQTLRIPKSSKVESDIEIPEDLYESMNQEMKRRFIMAFYECDGDSKQVRIIQAGKKLDEPPRVLRQIEAMLQSFGFATIEIRPSSVYRTSKYERRRWVLNIRNMDEKRKFKELFSFRKLSQLNIGPRVQEQKLA